MVKPFPRGTLVLGRGRSSKLRTPYNSEKLKMLRLARRSLAAVRHFSAEATTARAVVPESPAVSTTRSATNNSGGRDTLGRRLLSLIYTKRSAVITIRKWKEEGHMVRKYELNRIVRELRRLRRYKHALEICEWMTLQEDIKLTAGDYAVHLDLIAKIRGINSAEKFFEDLPDNMRGQPTCTALLHTYVQHKVSSKAEALMEKMSECGFLKYPLPYNHMMSLYISNGELEKIPRMIRELKKNTSPDIVTYNLWLAVCASLSDVERAEKILLELQKAKVEPDWVTYSTLTSIYTKNSLNEKAATTLKEMEKRVSRKVRIAYASVISLHTALANKDDVFRVWKKMKSLFRKMNDAEYICMISALVKLNELNEAEKLYTEWESVSTTGDTRVPNLILAAYINKNEMEKAENFFQTRMLDKEIVPSYTTWELLTWAYIKQNDIEKVLNFFSKAIGSVKKWEYDGKLVQKVYEMLEEDGNIEGAEKVLVILRKAGHVKTEVYNLVLRTYANAGKMPLVVAERMKMDKVEMDEETRELIEATSKMCVSEVSSILS